jgi:hypothetical protein
MNSRERKKAFEAIENEMSVQSRKGDLSRARSISAGIYPGGVTEVIMRGDGSYMWIILQPVEVIEFIHQLAANVGCHIHVQPRKDFASWRNWKYTEEELNHYRNGGGGRIGSGHAPHVNDMEPHMLVGANLPPPEQQPGLNFAGKPNDEAVAVERPDDGRSADGAAGAS